ncbi:MAG: hypothetical protein Alpg2KO_18450 [Alphaproteobacteria bacterium]
MHYPTKMSRDLGDLDPDFAVSCRRLLAELGAGGKEYKPFCTLRHPAIQARLWRQSRTKSEIERACRSLHNHGAKWLAELLDGVGPQYGPWATSKLPGQSWHQHGLALDVYRVVGGKAVWEPDAYEPYALAAKAMGFVSGHFWRRKDSVHIQMKSGRVMDTHNWSSLDQLMRERFA